MANNQEILTKAIQKAIAGGFNPGPSENGEPPQQTFTRRIMQDLFFRQALIFNHDFAKALWGESHHPYTEAWYLLPEDIDKFTHEEYEWQYHLKKMVIADDPIKYLGNNL